MLVILEWRNHSSQEKSTESGCAFTLADEDDGFFKENGSQQQKHFFVGEDREEDGAGEAGDCVLGGKAEVRHCA